VQHLLRAEALRDVRAEIRREEQTLMMSALTEFFEPVRAHLLQMPRQLAPRVNPGDPPHGETVLRDWLMNELFPLMNRKPEPKAKA
jgi:hypothetical protein